MKPGALRERPTAVELALGVVGPVQTPLPVEDDASAALKGRPGAYREPPLEGEGPPLSEADLFAAHSIGVRE